MSKTEPAAQERAATTDETESYTTHVEPPAQGGGTYVRCTDCGREVIGTDPSRLPHAAGCSHR